jgi:hypothetical protein
MHADSFEAAPPVDGTLDATTTIASGLADGPHELVLRFSGTNIPCIHAIRTYSPARRTELTAPGPRLVVSPASPGSLNLTRDWLPGWALDKTTVPFPDCVWQTVNNPWRNQGTVQVLKLNVSEQAGWFRLRYGTALPLQ